jgi:hypothetical protein
VERPHRLAAGEGLVRGGGLGERGLVERADHRVERGVDRVEPAQGGLDGLAAGDLPGADQGRQLDRVETPELGSYDRTS